MSLVRVARRHIAVAARPVAQATYRPLFGAQQRAYAEDASTKSNNAQPKILNTQQPKEEELSEEAKAHNADVEKRNAKAKNEDVEKDKVKQGYWAGSECYIVGAHAM